MNSNKQQKVILIIPRMGNGGAERVMATLANELVSLGFQTRIVTLTSNVSFYELDQRVEIIGADIVVNKKNKFARTLSLIRNSFRGLSFLHRQIKEWKPTIGVSFLTHTNLLSVIIKILHPEVKIIVSERAEPNERNVLIRFATKYMYTLADLIVCQSKLVSSFFPKYSHSKIRVIENPINEKSIPRETPKQRRKTIVGVGRLFEQKNFSMLINSFHDISTSFPEYTLEIYGEGPLRSKLEKQIEDLGLGDRVFLMGVKKNVMYYVYDAELFIMSSNFEGFPNVLVEAMASGLPVISTDFSTGVARDLVSEDNGILVPVCDQSALTLAIKSILSNEEMRLRMSENNRTINKLLSTDRIMKKWIRAFFDEI